MAGFISLLLTLLNIAIIIVIACMMFWCKSVVKYEGESSGWQDEFEKYKAANFIVRNDQKGRALAKRAAFVAKLATGFKTTTRKTSDIFCCGCFKCGSSGGNGGGRTGGGGGGGRGRGGSVPRPNITTNGLKKQGGQVQMNDLTPHLNASRPVAQSIFDLPQEAHGEGSPDLFPGSLPQHEAHAVTNAVTMGHKTLERMFSRSNIERAETGEDGGGGSAERSDTLTHGSGGSMRGLHSTSMSPSSLRLRRSSIGGLQGRQKTIGVGKSLFAGRRQQHDYEAEALQNAAREIARLRSQNQRGRLGHSRVMSHSQYLETMDRMDFEGGGGDGETSIGALFDSRVQTQ